MTRALVCRHRDKIERVACAVLQYRTLSGRAIDALLPEIPAPARLWAERLPVAPLGASRGRS
jgi:hypothetical protein